MQLANNLAAKIKVSLTTTSLKESQTIREVVRAWDTTAVVGKTQCELVSQINKSATCAYTIALDVHRSVAASIIYQREKYSF